MVGESRWVRVFSHLVLGVASLVVLLPLLWVARTSFADKVVAYKIPPDLFFSPTLDNYREILLRFDFGRFFLNSMVIALATTVIAVVIGSLAAYAIDRYRTGGAFAPLAILAFYLVSLALLLLVGRTADLSPYFYVGLIAYGLSLFTQARRVRLDDPAKALRLFKLNSF